jgi:cytidylate kinase
MIITIAGLSGSGKNTLGAALAEKLGYSLVCPTFKDLASAEGIPLLEFQQKAAQDPDIDKKFDAMLKEQAKGDCVVTTWLGPWMVEADVRIWVFTPDGIRAERLAKRDGITAEQAVMHIRKRDDDNRRRYQKVYGIDIDNHERFDVCLNSGIYLPEQLVDIVLKVIDTKKEM